MWFLAKSAQGCDFWGSQKWWRQRGYHVELYHFWDFFHNLSELHCSVITFSFHRTAKKKCFFFTFLTILRQVFHHPQAKKPKFQVKNNLIGTKRKKNKHSFFLRCVLMRLFFTWRLVFFCLWVMKNLKSNFFGWKSRQGWESIQNAVFFLKSRFQCLHKGNGH